MLIMLINDEQVPGKNICEADIQSKQVRASGNTYHDHDDYLIESCVDQDSAS